MADVILEFEKPIAELESKLAEWKSLGASNKVDMSEEIAMLTKKVEETKKSIYLALTPWQRVQLARHPNRPYVLDYISLIFTDFLECHGDRRYSDDPAIVGGFAKLDNQPVMLIGTQKGRNTKENVFRNFGCPHPEGYRKALRLMMLADKAKIPIITMIDTPGAFPGIASEERHIGEAIAVNLREMFNLSVPVIAAVIGEGGSGGALGIGVGNRILIMENAYYSVITPEGCAAILWKDRAFSAKAAEALKLSAKDLKKLNIVDEIIEEPLGGAHKNPSLAAELLKKAFKKNLADFSGISEKDLREQRYRKYRDIAFFKEE
ncbi:MAG: acetyl-CoA carboxylase carboxyltransferase subunit alpha [Lentisphaerae bacterium GWF2_44_16]|nr:MAG: acetyl-CoA carboxylase carboxyltransferase subunit alpha [Lentisphaerae bacterium GWF2_44_16]